MWRKLLALVSTGVGRLIPATDRGRAADGRKAASAMRKTVLALICLVSPAPIDVDRGLLWIDLPLAALVALVCYPVFRSGQQVSRLEGGLFVSAYLLYLGLLLWLRA